MLSRCLLSSGKTRHVDQPASTSLRPKKQKKEKQLLRSGSRSHVSLMLGWGGSVFVIFLIYLPRALPKVVTSCRQTNATYSSTFTHALPLIHRGDVELF